MKNIRVHFDDKKTHLHTNLLKIQDSFTDNTHRRNARVVCVIVQMVVCNEQLKMMLDKKGKNEGCTDDLVQLQFHDLDAKTIYSSIALWAMCF